MGFLDPKPMSRAEQSANYASQLTVSSGTTTAAINAWLAAPSPLGVKRLVGAATITAPLVTPSSGTVDFSGATITLQSGVVACNMLQNPAATPVQTIAGCSSTVGSNVITGTGFTPDMTGKRVGLTGAGSPAGNPTPRASDWFGIFNYVSATQGTITPALAAEGATVVNAGATVASAALKIYGRDSNLTIIGGMWNRNATNNINGDSNWHHTMFLRHIDKLKVRDVNFNIPYGNGAKYAIAIGDWTDASVENIQFACGSDGLHFTGPGRGAYVSNLRGWTRDDMLSFTALDFGAYGDCSGDISEVRAYSINQDGAAGGGAIFKTIAGYQTVVRDMVIDGIHGSSANSGCVGLADDGTGPSDIDVTLRNVTARTLTTTSPVFNISATAAKNIEIDGFVASTMPGRSATVSDALIKVIGAPKRLIIKNVTGRTFGSNAWTMMYIGVPAGAIIDYLHLEDWSYAPPNGNSHLPVNLHSQVRRMVARSINVENTSRMIWQDVNAFSLILQVSDLTLVNTDNGIIDTQGGLDLTYSNCYVDTFGGYFRSRSTIATTITVRGTGLFGNRTPTVNAVNRGGQTGTLTLKIDDPRFPTDVSLLAKSNGDRAWNTNAALACGVGSVISDGTNWKNIYSGAIY